ncbi:MAG: hypothetical protein M3Q44_01475 [bacterium]|nr:hypothetical protein [bacterium]
MKIQKEYTATQARQNFFELLRLAEAGEEPVITKSDSNTTFKIVKSEKKKPKKDIGKIIKKMGKIGLVVGTPEDIKKIITTMHDIKV